MCSGMSFPRERALDRISARKRHGNDNEDDKDMIVSTAKDMVGEKKLV